MVVAAKGVVVLVAIDVVVVVFSALVLETAEVNVGIIF